MEKDNLNARNESDAYNALAAKYLLQVKRREDSQADFERRYDKIREETGEWAIGLIRAAMWVSVIILAVCLIIKYF